MISNSLKNYAKKWIINYFDYRMLKELSQRDAEILSKHPEFEDLTEKEKKMIIYPSDVNQLKLYKNVRGGELEYGFISDATYQSIILPKLNKMDYSLNRRNSKGNIFHDKNYFDLILKYLKTPEVVLRNVDGEFLDENYATVSNPYTLLNEYDELVFKKSLESGHGKDVKLVKKSEYQKMMDMFGEDYIIQTKLRQSANLSKWNESSVNIIRITSLYWKGDIYILGGILRVGAPGEFCDHTTSDKGVHPRIIGINDDGTLINRVIDPDTATIYSDCWGRKAEGRINKYKEMKEIVIKEHSRFPHHKIIGWDLTLDENDNIFCIEYNASVPGVIQSQYALGPIFGQKSVRGVPLLAELMKE